MPVSFWDNRRKEIREEQGAGGDEWKLERIDVEGDRNKNQKSSWKRVIDLANWEEKDRQEMLDAVS